MEKQDTVDTMDPKKIHNEKIALTVLSWILGVSLFFHVVGIILNFLNIDFYSIAVIGSLASTVNFYLLIISVFVYALNKNSVNVQALKILKKVLITSFVIHGLSFLIGMYIFMTGTW